MDIVTDTNIQKTKINLLIKPSEFFAKLVIERESYRFALMLLLLEAIVGALMILLLPVDSLTQKAFVDLKGTVDKQTIKSTIELLTSPFGVIVLFLFNSILLSITIYIKAFLLHILLLLFRGTGSVRAAFVVLCYSQVPLIIKTLLGFIYSVSNFQPQTFENGLSQIVSQEFNVFIMWSYYIAMIGLSEMYSVKKKVSIFILLIITGFLFLLTRLGALFNL